MTILQQVLYTKKSGLEIWDFGKCYAFNEKRSGVLGFQTINPF
jgi:hypothetical protein